MEPPSPTLAAALRDLSLATSRDLNRAAGLCRSIARDLPTFDCVWIDALLSLRRVTPFQAGRLQDGDAAGLRIGPFVLVDRLGRGPESATYLARPVDGGPTVVLKQLPTTKGYGTSLRERINGLVREARVLRSPHVVAPDRVLDTTEGVVTVSRFVPGQDAGTRLVRHGPISGEAAAEIACQLAGGLAEAHRAGLPHGEVRIGNLRITKAGDAVLVDHGIAAAASPTLVIDAAAPPERYDGIAPELIGSPVAPGAASDVYALGCLLWHLLAGRPPFTAGDPLAKLAAHRTRPVPDVRDFAPGVSDALAHLLTQMTALDPARRPMDLEEVRRRLRRTTRSKRSTLSHAARDRSKGHFPWSVATAVLIALSGLSVSLLDRGGTAAVLRAAVGTSASSGPEAADIDAASFSALPPPDAEGTIHLEHGVPYAPADVAFRGPLLIRGRPDQPATIVVTDRPLHLWADSVVLENVRILRGGSDTPLGGAPALVLIETQKLSLRSCRVEGLSLPIARRDSTSTAIAWRMLDRTDPTAGRIEIRDCVFRGTRESLFAADRLRQLQVENVLAVGQRSLVSLGTAGGESAITLRNLTLRDADSVISCRASSAASRIGITAEDCVIALAKGGRLVSEGESSSDVTWSGTSVFVSGELDATPSKTVDASLRSETEENEGAIRADIRFAGPTTGSDAASVAKVSGAPRLAGRSPGFDLSRVPREAAVVGQPR